MPPAPPEGLQQIPEDVGPSAEATAVSRRLLTSVESVSEACELVAGHFLGSPEVEAIVVALTLTPPDDRTPWVHLGDRVWPARRSSPSRTATCCPPRAPRTGTSSSSAPPPRS